MDNFLHYQPETGTYWNQNSHIPASGAYRIEYNKPHAKKEDRQETGWIERGERIIIEHINHVRGFIDIDGSLQIQPWTMKRLTRRQIIHYYYFNENVEAEDKTPEASYINADGGWVLMQDCRITKGCKCTLRLLKL